MSIYNALDQARADQLETLFETVQAGGITLHGLASAARLDCLIRQIISSERRNRYIKVVQSRPIAPSAAVPFSRSFDPIKAAKLMADSQDYENAHWLVFLLTHFGRHRVGQWRYAEEVFGRVNDSGLWDWQAVVDDIVGFRDWLSDNRDFLKRPGSGFGNHRKYESLGAWSANGTGAVVSSYLNWVGETRSQANRFAVLSAEVSETVAFERAFVSLSAIHRYGRTARFDHLMMLSRLGIVDMRPGHAYLKGSTGPMRGASLLLDGSVTPRQSAQALGEALVQINSILELDYDVLEDAICNWQKSSSSFKLFRG